MNDSTITLEASYEAMRAIGPWLIEQVPAIGAGHLSDRVGEFELAVHELAVNIVDHAFDDNNRPGASFAIELSCEADDLVVRFVDRGRPFDHGDKPTITDEPTVRGYGLFIVEQLARSVDYARIDDRNEWTLVFGSGDPG